MFNKFVILVTCRNVQDYIFNCLQSIKEQSYKNYKVIIVDDCSTDKTLDIISKFNSSKFSIVKNDVRKWKTKNIKYSIQFHQESEEDIFIFLDGDDWLANSNVLSTLNRVYNDTDCLLTYGSYLDYPSMTKGKFAKQLPQNVVDNRDYKNYSWSTSHLVSFRTKLFNAIPEEYFLDWNGEYLKSGADVACILPMLEMAGNKIQYIDDILYIYNNNNPLNDHKVDAEMQHNVDKWIRSKPKLEVLK